MHWHLLKQDNRPLWSGEIPFNRPENPPFPPATVRFQPHPTLSEHIIIIVLDDAGSCAG